MISAWDCVGCKIFPTSTSFSNFYKTNRDSERGAESEVAHKWARWLHNPCRLGGAHHFRAGAESEVAHKWAR